MKINLDVGYRHDNLDWNIGSEFYGQYVNVLSELTWKDLEIYQARLGGELLTDQHIYLRGYGGYGGIFAGSNQDSDYAGSNRTLEFSRSNNSSKDGHVSDLSIGVGYRFRPVAGRLAITPLIGYSRDQQALKMTNGNQTISDPTAYPGDPADLPPLGPFGGLNSSYTATWSGFWAGVDVSLNLGKKLTAAATFEYHLANYNGKANWNLRNDFAHPVSFSHDAEGDGIVLSGGIQYAATSTLSAGVEVSYQRWSTGDGIDRTIWADGSSGDTTLNEVNWTSHALMFKLIYTPPPAKPTRLR